MQQAEVVDKVLREIEVNTQEQTTLEKGIETSKKINSVIQNLITSENMILVTADAKMKKERFLSMNINTSMVNFADQLQGTGAPNY